MARKKKSSKWTTLFVAAALIACCYYFASHYTYAEKYNAQRETKLEREPTERTSNSQDRLKRQSLNLKLEIPVATREHPEIIVEHTAFTLSYNSQTMTPNWVAWELNREETEGDEGRESKFSPDPLLPEPRVTHKDYSNSGYDRGHMAPAADMKWNEQAMKESFYTSNICPQNRKLNRDDWKDLENACREWAKKYGTIYIACGPIYDSKRPKRIGEHQVAIPDRFYKVVLVYNRKNPFTLAFLFKNEGHHQALMNYQTTVDEVENITGFDFFAKLPNQEEEKLESIVSPLPAF